MVSKSLELIPDWIAPSSWWQHVPIAHWLTCELKPEIVVELGTHYGVSFFGFCEAAEAFSRKSFIYAVDTWEGDAHAGEYNENVFQQVQEEASRRHKLRSRLIRSSFDEAAKYFEDEAIDLLHIDGLHTYEAVRHDYETWLPKMKEDSIILFHDINVREREFGVWKLWHELKEDSLTYETANGHGLGILVKGQKLEMKISALAETLPLLKSKGALLEMLAESRSEGRFDTQQVQKEQDQLSMENESLKIRLLQAEKQIKEIENSTIWKLSNPLRKAYDATKRIIKNKNHP